MLHSAPIIPYDTLKEQKLKKKKKANIYINIYMNQLVLHLK